MPQLLGQLEEAIWLLVVKMLCWFGCQYEEVAERDDLMGVEETAKRDILSVLLVSVFNVFDMCVFHTTFIVRLTVK